MPDPLMSVVLVTMDSYRRIQKTVGVLAAQSVSGTLQLVIASPAALCDASDDCLSRFHSVVFTQTGPFRSAGHPRAAAVARCTAPIVAFAEDHCFPGPLWAETLIGLHNNDWAAVSPALRNANPGACSAADMLLNFGPFICPAASGCVLSLPWHNTSYLREWLCGYGDRLAHMLEAEVRLQEDLIRRGYRMRLAVEIEASHVNLSRWRSFLGAQLFGGRLYGSARAEAGLWGTAKRISYVAASPLIPILRAPRIFNHARRTMPTGRNLPFLLACVAGLFASAAGEAYGYLRGPGNAGCRRITYEYDRVRHIRFADKKLMQ